MDRDQTRSVRWEEEEEARSPSIFDDDTNRTGVVNPEDHQWPWLVPGIPAIDINVTTVPTFTPHLLPDTHECPNEEIWRRSVYIYEWTVEYLRSTDAPVYPPPTETSFNPDPLDFCPDVNIPFVPPSPPSPVPGPSRQSDETSSPAFEVPENSNSQQDIPATPSTSTSASPTPGTSRQSEELELLARPKRHHKKTARFMSRWLQHGDDTDGERSAFKPYARQPKVMITPPSPTFTIDEVVISSCPLPDTEVPAPEEEVEISRDSTTSSEHSVGGTVDALSNPLLVLSAVCSEELRLLEGGSDSDDKT